MMGKPYDLFWENWHTKVRFNTDSTCSAPIPYRLSTLRRRRYWTTIALDSRATIATSMTRSQNCAAPSVAAWTSAHVTQFATPTVSARQPRRTPSRSSASMALGSESGRRQLCATLTADQIERSCGWRLNMPERQHIDLQEPEGIQVILVPFDDGASASMAAHSMRHEFIQPCRAAMMKPPTCCER